MPPATVPAEFMLPALLALPPTPPLALPAVPPALVVPAVPPLLLVPSEQALARSAMPSDESPRHTYA